MSIKEFAQQLNGKEYGYPMFTEKEIQTAKDNGWVIVTGASDDLMEFKGAIRDEGGCFDGGKVFFSKSGVYNGEDDKYKFPNCIEAIWCSGVSRDGDGNTDTFWRKENTDVT